MHILQDAPRVICRCDLQIILHFLVPQCGQVIYRHMISEDRLFHFVAQYDMEAVSHFVCVYTDEAVLHVIDLLVESF